MILTFSKDVFVERILNGTKKHTIRKDNTNRWKKGMKIHFWRGNPRNVKNNPYQFAEGLVVDIAQIQIFPNHNQVLISFDSDKYSVFSTKEVLNDIARNDGFENWEEMKEWFNEDFIGKIIIWGNINE